MNAGRFERERARIEGKRDRGHKWRKRAMKHLVEKSGVQPITSGQRVVAWRTEDGKIACAKHRFKTEDAAQSALRQIAAEPEPRRKPVRAYPCYACGGWHLTSKEKP